MFESKKSPNFNDRVDGVSPSMIILHYTGMRTADEALERLCDPQSKVSAHYFIDEDGKITQLVGDQHRAWHAGAAYWAGEVDINSHSIGIEIVNPGHEFGYHSFPEVQLSSLVTLCKIKMGEYGVSLANVLGHSDIAPARKQDPGELFPWEALAVEGIGIWPRPEEMDYQAAEDVILNQQSLHELLAGFGYDPEAEFKDIITAFHRRFYPEKFQEEGNPGEPDISSAARLLALIRAKHEAET